MSHALLALASALALSNPVPRVQDAAAAPGLELVDERALHEALNAIATDHPELAALTVVGRSREGRAIEALRLAGGTPPPGRPAILVVANLDGPLVYTSSVALHEARELAARYGSDERVTKLLDSTTLYFVPRANPDAAAARFQSPLMEVEATGAGVDDDRDGRAGEDDRSDANGDGFVLSMRVADPEGEWIEDPAEPRVLIRADRSKGQRGTWKLVPEGRDSDGDEEVAEDPVHDAVVNRNFPESWIEHAPSSGLFPTDEPEAQALCNFVLDHPDLALVLVYGREHELGAKPEVAKGGGKRGDEALGFAEEDAALLEELGKRYRELTGNEGANAKEEPGSFQAWCHLQRGLWTIALRPWTVPTKPEKKKDKEPEGEKASEEKEGAGEAPAAKSDESAPTTGADRPQPEEPENAPAAPAATEEGGAKPKPEPEPSEDARALHWLEEHGVEPAYFAWTPFEHPELGAVEIGGFAPYVRVEPPPDLLNELAPKELEFLIALGELVPRVALVDVRAKELGGGLYEVKAALENASLLPLESRAALAARSERPARVRLALGVGASLVAGPRQELVGDLAGSGGRSEFRWIVRASDAGALKVEVETDNAGSASVAPEVK